MRFGLKLPTDSDYYNQEVSLNELRQLTQNAGLVEVCSNRVVSITNASATEITPTSGTSELHIFNGTGVTVRYGGSGVTTSTGGKIFNQGTLALKVTANASIYLIKESGGASNVDIIEFT